MKLLEGATGSTSYSNLQVEKTIDKLSFWVNAAIVNERISVRVESDKGTTNLINNLKIKDLAEICQFQEGAYQKFKTGQFEIVAIDIAKGFGLDMSGNKTIVVDLSNLTAGNQHHLYGLESPGILKEAYKYNLVAIPTGQQTKSIDTKKVELVAFQNSSSLVKVRLNYIDGSGIEFTKNELIARAIDLNDTVFTTGTITNTGAAYSQLNDQVKTGYDNFFILPIHDVVNVEPFTDQSASLDIYTLESVAI